LEAYDAIVVGSGPNGFAAAILLQQQGLQTLLIEGADTLGGGMRTKEITLPGFKHDICSAIHPMALASPFLSTLPLAEHGLQFVFAPNEVAHPLDTEHAAILHRDLEQTALGLGKDSSAYKALLEPFVKQWDDLSQAVLGPLRFPRNPMLMAKFGLKALPSAAMMAKNFETTEAKALWAGLCAHGIQPLENLTTAAIGIMLGTVGHRFGWPTAVGGSQAVADALASYFKAIGGNIQTDYWVDDVNQLPNHKVLLLDMTPKQVLNIKGLGLRTGYRNQLKAYRQGLGVFKMDWALSDPIPFRNPAVMQSSTVHLGGTYEEIARAEYHTAQGRIPDAPYVLLSQQSLFDSTRAPAGKHTAWAYCHVPHGSTADCTKIIENQIERFAPGFKDTILAKHTFNTQQMESYNPNYVGGDINGGIMDLAQLYTRPSFSLTPYRTSNKNVYIASSSTPPGGGVHGMCGFHAARIALEDHFNVKITL